MVVPDSRIRPVAVATAYVTRQEPGSAGTARRIMETKPPVPRALLVGVQLPDVDDGCRQLRT